MAYTNAMTFLAHLGPDAGAHHGSIHLLWIVVAALAAVALGFLLRRSDSHRA